MEWDHFIMLSYGQNVFCETVNICVPNVKKLPQGVWDTDGLTDGWMDPNPKTLSLRPWLSPGQGRKAGAQEHMSTSDV